MGSTPSFIAHANFDSSPPGQADNAQSISNSAKDLKIITHTCRTRTHGIFPISIRPSDLEHVENIKEIEFFPAVAQCGAREVGMAVVFEAFFVKGLVNVGITSCASEGMDFMTYAIDAIMSQSVT